ncbi:MAG: peptide deformylase [Patescibacteria group bacterium]|nr:peptide deformylase [Patescibacteria group bacterium]
MILPVVTYPNKILRQPAEPVAFPLSKEIAKLTRDMIDTVRQQDGVGLAAPQVGASARLVVINLEKEGIPAFALYNPKIVSKSLKKAEVEEGCLSLPGIFGMVRRPLKVKISAQNAEGKKISFTDNGWVARVAQHEIDHTNGILIIDLIKNYTKGGEIAKKLKDK